MLEFEPKHISMYILTVKDNYIHKSELPNETYIEEEYLKASEFLKSQGYNHYEVSNFSLSGQECLHNMKYWSSDSVAAIGPSATGYLVKNAENAIRYKWKNKLLKYDLEILDQEQVSLEREYLSFRTSRGLNILSNETRALAKNWADRSLGHFLNDKFHLNSKGFLVLDSLMNEYFSAISRT